jgi:hypothetical protein
MSIHPERPEHQERPVEVEGVPDEEGISEADAAERVGLDPDEQPNRTDDSADRRDRPADQS